MLTTTLRAQPEEPLVSPAKTMKRDASVPGHLAVVLNAGVGQKSPSLKVAVEALNSLLSGCVERGVAVLTLLHPPGDAEIFEAALAELRSSASGAQLNAVRLNLRASRDGRTELVEAIRNLSAQVCAGKLSAEKIDAAALENCLSTRGLPPIDLLVTTGGGARLSGALVWQSAYSELLFVDVAWFNFNRNHFNDALADYAKRCRKFGGLV